MVADGRAVVRGLWAAMVLSLFRMSVSVGGESWDHGFLQYIEVSCPIDMVFETSG